VDVEPCFRAITSYHGLIRGRMGAGSILSAVAASYLPANFPPRVRGAAVPGGVGTPLAVQAEDNVGSLRDAVRFRRGPRGGQPTAWHLRLYNRGMHRKPSVWRAWYPVVFQGLGLVMLGTSLLLPHYWLKCLAATTGLLVWTVGFGYRR